MERCRSRLWRTVRIQGRAGEDRSLLDRRVLTTNATTDLSLLGERNRKFVWYIWWSIKCWYLNTHLLQVFFMKALSLRETVSTAMFKINVYWTLLTFTRLMDVWQTCPAFKLHKVLPQLSSTLDFKVNLTFILHYRIRQRAVIRCTQIWKTENDKHFDSHVKY